jgi:hypothetical protein
MNSYPSKIKSFSFVNPLFQGGFGHVCLYEKAGEYYAIKLEEGRGSI